jgi:hypothetical protein
MSEETKKKRLRWDGTPRTMPRHPYRDSAIMYAVLAGVVVGVTALTGGNVRTALIIAPVLFVVATGYSWWRWHRQQQSDAAEGE